MPSLNAAARSAMALAAGNLAATGTLVIYSGATALATHTLVGGSESGGVYTFSPIADVTITGTGTNTADSAKLIEAGREVTLTIGTSAAEVIVPSLSYTAGGTSTINSVTITYPAS